ncbi:MAG: FAD-dependent thymidylate synthase, partial [Patescibacteria group bacterium]
MSVLEVKLLAHTNIDPLDLASHAAKTCYQDKLPELGKRLDVESRLFNVGHHTTIQHHSVTFSIEGIAVGDITFGVHLANIFYISCQRSGRYCAKMFLEPDYGEIECYIRKFWPNISNNALALAMDYIKTGINVYHENIAMATEIAGNF